MLGSLMLVGAGCGGGATSGSGAAVSSAFTAAQIKFTAKDKTDFAKKALGADGELLANFTEYKFDGSSMILLVGEAKDASSRPMIADKLSDQIKPMAAAASLDYSSVGGLNDPKWFAYVLAKDSDSATKMKVLGTISK